MELTRRYSKDQILEMYMNEILYGNRAYGIEAAAETYFGKPAKELTPGRSVAAGRPAPGAVAVRPVHQPAGRQGAPELRARPDGAHRRHHPGRARRRGAARRSTWSRPASRPRRGAALRHLRPPAARAAVRHRSPVPRRPADHHQPRPRPAAPGREVGHRPHRRPQGAQRDQRRAGRHPARDGEVLAMLGSVNFDDPAIDGQVNVALALRQPGSTLKPFTYVTAFGKGWNPATMMWDIPTTFPGGYKPNDFDDKFPGPMTVRDALAQSRNIPAVEALQFVGVPGHAGDRPPVRDQRPARPGALRPVGDARRRRGQTARPDLCLLGVRQRRPADRLAGARRSARRPASASSTRCRS